MWRPKVGQTVRLHYAAKPKRRGMPPPARLMPFEGKIGTVEAVASGRPRNALVALNIGGTCLIVPSGNLFATEPTEESQ